MFPFQTLIHFLSLLVSWTNFTTVATLLVILSTSFLKSKPVSLRMSSHGGLINHFSFPSPPSFVLSLQLSCLKVLRPPRGVCTLHVFLFSCMLGIIGLGRVGLDGIAWFYSDSPTQRFPSVCWTWGFSALTRQRNYHDSHFFPLASVRGCRLFLPSSVRLLI